MHQYGIDINALDKFINTPPIENYSWGHRCCIIDTPEYRLERFDIENDKTATIMTKKDEEATIFVETGVVRIQSLLINANEAISIAPQSTRELYAQSASSVYTFFGPHDTTIKNIFERVVTPFDYRDKYWGNIQTIVSKRYAAKRLFVRRAYAASLEFHCRKLESYYIHSGKLLLRLRAGRGEDRFFELASGNATLTPPGLMHQRGGLEDTVIIEISTRDDDGDSYLVEDGAKHKMPQLLTRIHGEETKDQKRICFDIDSVLCTQIRDGDYTKAKPIPNAIALVNQLFNEGHVILIYTGRFMGRHQNDWKKAYEDGYVFTKQQLDSWGLKYHDLFLGKPDMDVFIDDKALFYNPDLATIENEIRNRIASL